MLWYIHAMKYTCYEMYCYETHAMNMHAMNYMQWKDIAMKYMLWIDPVAHEKSGRIFIGLKEFIILNIYKCRITYEYNINNEVSFKDWPNNHQILILYG